MTVDNVNYSITVESGKQYLTNKVVGTDSLQLDVYAFSDTSYVDSLLNYSLDEDEKQEIEIASDGRYWLVLTFSSTVVSYELAYYPFFKGQFLEELQDFLCNCTYDTAINGCISCEEQEDLDAFSFSTYIIPHLYLFTEEDKMLGFHSYMNEGLKVHESFLQTIYTNMFWNRNIRGTYTFNIRSLQIIYSLIYVYFYEQDLLEDTDSDYVDTTYDITDMKTCIEKIGLFFTQLVSIFSITSVFGKTYVHTLEGITTPCTEIPDLLLNPTLTQDNLESGTTIQIFTEPNYIFIIIPKAWGALSEILDNGGMNLITDFTRTECGNYYLYQLDDILPPGSYTYKIVI